MLKHLSCIFDVESVNSQINEKYLINVIINVITLYHEISGAFDITDRHEFNMLWYYQPWIKYHYLVSHQGSDL